MKKEKTHDTLYSIVNNLEYVIMIGIVLSGKTTYRKGNFEHEAIALSDFGNVRKKELEYAEVCLKEQKSIVVDDTNLTKNIRRLHIDLAKKYDAKTIGIFLNTSIGLIKQRRWKRPDQLEMVVINKMLKELQVPQKDEGFDELIIVDG